MKTRIPLAATFYVALLMVPFYWLILMSVKSNKEIMSGISFWPQEPTFANFQLIFSDAGWYLGYVNALVYVAINVALSVSVAIPAAYAFSRLRFAGGRALFFGFLLFRMMAPAILLVPFVQIFSDLNLIDTHIAVAVAHCFFNVPLAIWILEGFISAIPREMDDLAKIDGYGPVAFSIKILLPQIAPGIAVTAFFCFMFSWVEFLISNGLTTTDAKPIGGIITRAGGVLAANVSLLSAASVLGLIPGIVLIIFVRKHLVRGFSMGRVV
nr:carbohydrate ABC transporter permease [uncultured Dongia sp.]